MTLSCCMLSLGWLLLQVAQWRVEHLPSTNQPCQSGEKLQAKGVSDPGAIVFAHVGLR